mmetsp:Transcript_89581/g.255865  ORF Transcript_89581/g.255865 Transcript_89581/m.255865 type:complete len:201 (-) Transcript_89581:509-1111(-)
MMRCRHTWRVELSCRARATTTARAPASPTLLLRVSATIPVPMPSSTPFRAPARRALPPRVSCRFSRRHAWTRPATQRALAGSTQPYTPSARTTWPRATWRSTTLPTVPTRTAVPTTDFRRRQDGTRSLDGAPLTSVSSRVSSRPSERPSERPSQRPSESEGDFLGFSEQGGFWGTLSSGTDTGRTAYPLSESLRCVYCNE